MTSRIEETRSALVARTGRSRDIGQRSHEILNMGSAASLEMPHPVFIAASDGARVFDADGNAYIDCQLGFGTHVLEQRRSCGRSTRLWIAASSSGSTILIRSVSLRWCGRRFPASRA